jgi:hypothetical protein
MRCLQALAAAIALLLPALGGAVDDVACEACVDSRDMADWAVTGRHPCVGRRPLRPRLQDAIRTSPANRILPAA